MSKKKSPGITAAPVPLPGVGVPAPYNGVIENLGDPPTIPPDARQLLLRVVSVKGVIETPEVRIERLVLKGGQKLRVVKLLDPDGELDHDDVNRLAKALKTDDETVRTVVLCLPHGCTVEVFEER